MASKVIWYCQVGVSVTGDLENPRAVIGLSGPALNPDGSVFIFGQGTGSAALEAGATIPLTYGMSVQDVIDQMVPLVQAGYQTPDFDPRVVILPRL